ncbi:hypothetical protein ACHQM5_000302 [Ranunculus cassubicifolius]
MTNPNPPTPLPKSPSPSTQTPLKRPPDYRAPRPSPLLTSPKPSPFPSPAMGYPPGSSNEQPQKPRIRRKKRSHYDNPSCCCSSACVCYYSFCTLFLLILLVAIFGVICYVWYQPKLPIFELTSVHFPRFNVTVKSGDSFLDTQTIAEIKVKNRNEKITFHYGESHGKISVLGDEISLGSTKIPGFIQWKSNITVLKFEMEVGNVLLSGSDADKLRNQFRKKDIAISIEIRTKIGVTLNSWHWKVGKLPVRFLCKNVTTKSLEGGAAENPKCSLKVFRLQWVFLYHNIRVHKAILS